MNQHHISVTVSRKQFASNIQHLRKLVEPASVCVVMKANAYGHGLAGLVSTAVQAGADVIGICTNPEASTVRAAAPAIRMLRLRMALPDELEESLDSLEIEEQIGTLEAAEFLDRAGRRRARPVPVHLKVDTGMGRGGFLPGDLELLKRICAMPGLDIIGVMTHLANADAETLVDAQQQLDDFASITDALASELPDGVQLHSHNSAATMRLSEQRRDMVRVGAACYGVRTSRHFDNPPECRPVMSVKSRIAQVRSVPSGTRIGYGGLYTTQRASRIASIPVGFGEGYPRGLFNKGIVLIDGHRCPVVGRVSLNVTTIDVTDLPTIPKWGDEVVLFGDQGGESISFEEMADTFHSVHTEINLSAGLMNQIEYLDD